MASVFRATPGPEVPVTDLRIRQKDLVVSTQGRSLWILDDLTPLSPGRYAVGFFCLLLLVLLIPPVPIQMN